jgi:hypothetical protein
MTREEFAQYFSGYVTRTFKRQKAAARHWGVSGAMISAVACGLKPPTKVMLKEIGFTREIVKTEVYEVSHEPRTHESS